MRRAPHENVATVLVAPSALPDLELELMTLDLSAWPVRTAPICADGPRQEFQLRRRLVEQNGWADAADWIPVWISFGVSWRNGDDPLPWSAHDTLWRLLASYDGQVRFRKRLGGVPKLAAPQDLAA